MRVAAIAHKPSGWGRLLITTAALLLVTACKSEPAAPPPAPPPPPAPKEVVTCMIQISPKLDGPYEGRAEGPKEEQVLADAWAAVCAKLPAVDQPTCKDEKKFAVSKSGGSFSAGGPKTYSQTITLERRPPLFEASESADDKETACKAALEAACKAAGSAGDCLATGKFEKKGYGTTVKGGAFKF